MSFSQTRSQEIEKESLSLSHLLCFVLLCVNGYGPIDMTHVDEILMYENGYLFG